MPSRNEWNEGPILDETVSSLRHRLGVMRQVFGDDDDDEASMRRKRAAMNRLNKKNKNCMDSIIDGSIMGLVLAVCLCMVLGAAFFAYKNLYYAVLKKIYPEN